MVWYVAHAIVSVRKKSGKQRNIPVYENAFLIEGGSHEEAMDKAIAIAKENASYGGDNLTLDDAPAFLSFEGIRKLIKISNPIGMKADLAPPTTGTELTYSEFIVRNISQLKRLTAGESIKLTYVD